MYQRKRWHRVTAILLTLTLIFTSIPAMAFAETEAEAISNDETIATSEDVAAESEADETASDEASLEDNLELEEGVSEENALSDESTEESTTFDLGSGKKMVIFHSQNVRYEDEDGELQDYDPALVKLEPSSTGPS